MWAGLGGEGAAFSLDGRVWEHSGQDSRPGTVARGTHSSLY